jgi:hypothetical protein
LALPLSYDSAKMEVLRQSVAVYRMVFGQSRQEDLLAYLVGQVPESDLQAVAQNLRMDLSPPKRDSEWKKDTEPEMDSKLLT